jgi:hypothetical protein
MSEQPWNQELGRPDETDPRKRLREAMAGSRLAGGGDCLQTVAKVPAGRASLVCALNVRMGREAAVAAARALCPFPPQAASR